jgi:DHA1 family tetracycline resistance protein-like MFS transporter
VPDDAQGELQGGISAVTNLAMLAGTLTFAQVFGRFMAEDSTFRSPDVAYNLAAVLLVGTLVLFLAIVRRPPARTET